jgi:hypothetical protein
MNPAFVSLLVLIMRKLAAPQLKELIQLYFPQFFVASRYFLPTMTPHQINHTSKFPERQSLTFPQHTSRL